MVIKRNHRYFYYKPKFIPYRDSMLTRLVTNAFKKDTQLALIATLSPEN